MLRRHARNGHTDGAVGAVLERVHLPGDRAFQRRFPHQLSGGQQQRVAIAIALVCTPPVVVMDEPTTGLDVITQAVILKEIDRLRSSGIRGDGTGLAIVYVSHDLAVVAYIADRIAVMYAGRIVEEGPAAGVLARPRHPYTRGLVSSIPDHLTPRRLRGMPGVAVGVGERPTGCAFASRCPQHLDACDLSVPALSETSSEHHVRCIQWQQTPPLTLDQVLEPMSAVRAELSLLAVENLRAEHRVRSGAVVAAHDVSFSIAGGECLALVGESGSGKTTIARCVAGLHAPSKGQILLSGTALAGSARDRSREQRRRIGIVFQNPYDSLNPRHRVRDIIARPAVLLRELSHHEAAKETASLLERVRLSQRLAMRFPTELSGGERQRVAIARALAAQPDLLICDEVTSALDVSVQAAVLELLASLRSELRLAMLFISHDLGVVASVADRVIVLERGLICEQGRVDVLLRHPTHEYTQRLIVAAPRLPEASAIR
jgi:peptide/nickel transport system ATP-binding protein